MQREVPENSFWVEKRKFTKEREKKKEKKLLSLVTVTVEDTNTFLELLLKKIKQKQLLRFDCFNSHSRRRILCFVGPTESPKSKLASTLA